MLDLLVWDLQDFTFDACFHSKKILEKSDVPPFQLYGSGKTALYITTHHKLYNINNFMCLVQ